MRQVGAFEAKNTLGTLLDRVERGEEIVITRHGKAVARLVPNTARVDQGKTRAVLERIRGRAKAGGSEAAGFDWEKVKESRDRGRP